MSYAGKNLTNTRKRTIINITTRDGAVWKLVGLITRRSQAISEKTGSVIGTGFFSFVEIEARAWYNSRRQGTPEKEIQQKIKGE